MHSFLDDLADTILEYPSDQLQQSAVVLPSRRALLYLKKSIAQKTKKPIWLPELLTFEDFVSELSPLEIVDKTELLFIAYEVYKEVAGPSADSFDDFSSWGGMALSDFHDLDRYLLDAHTLFKDLSQVKEMESWDPSGDSLRNRFLDFWKILSPFYHALVAHLNRTNKAYQGMMYRHLAASSQDSIFLNIRWSKIWLAGLNALSPAEEKIVEQVLEGGKAEILWDADAHYLNNTEHEAGLFMRRFKKDWTWYRTNDFETIYSNYTSGKKNFQFVASDHLIQMCQHAAQIISSWDHEKVDFEKTAVVLADESMLIPMMNALPSSVKAINITLGYPLADTPIVDFLFRYLSIHESGRAISAGKVPYPIYLPRLKQWVGHVYFDIVFGQYKKELGAVLSRRSNFISAKEMENITGQNGYWDGTLAQRPVDLLQKLIQLCETIYEHGATSNQKWITEQAYLARKSLLQLHVLLEKYPYLEDIKTMKNFIRQTLKVEKMDLFGEPLAGLQMLGMLETRALDFERVMVVGANEGLIPAGTSAASFIPYGVRMAYGLPTHREKEAIYMYHIYRLMQRAKEVTLLYTTDSDGLGAKEKSRVIDQIEIELGALHDIEHISFPSPPLNIAEQLLTTIPKSAKHLERLTTMSFSPSSLNLYNECPVEFFFEKVLGMRSPKEYDLDHSQGEFGTVVHDSLETLYKPFLNRPLTAEIVEGLILKSKDVVSAFVEKHLTEDSRHGMGLLMKEAAIKTVLNFLKEEIAEIRRNGEPTLISLEDEIAGEIKVGEHTMLLKGKIDRIDRVGNQLRIIDYKTGSIGDFTTMKPETDYTKIPSAQKQLLIYQWLVAHKYSDLEIGLPVVISLKKMEWTAVNSGNLTLKELPPLTENFLQTLLGEILNPEMPFVRNPKFQYAQFGGIATR